MYVITSKSANATSYYIQESIRKDKVKTSRVIEKLGTEEELKKKLGVTTSEEVMAWAKERARELSEKKKEETQKPVIVKYEPNHLVEKNRQNLFNGGYLFCQQVFYELGLDRICKDIGLKYKFDYDLCEILSRLVYGRILYPASKLGTWRFSKKLLEQSSFTEQNVYRALSVLSKEAEFIQSQLYKNSVRRFGRNNKILYYDCTNFFFEIEEEDEDGMRKYGYGKDHKPNPLVEVGMFMDGDGIPLALCVKDGNCSEQKTLIPLEKQLLEDFHLSKFVVCTDAGLSGGENRLFNNMGERAFITVQSVKKLERYLEDWALSPEKWSCPGGKKNVEYNIQALIDGTDAKVNEKYGDTVFYKERVAKFPCAVTDPVTGQKKEIELEQRIIVTFSSKYQQYLRTIRDKQVMRAKKKLDTKAFKKGNGNDYRRFISMMAATEQGEAAQVHYYIDETAVSNEAKYDGFYAVCTNLTDPCDQIVEYNKARWQIEECFRILKDDFCSRPVYLQRDDRIVAHFLSCFLALVVYRYIEKKINRKYTCSEIVDTLREYRLLDTGNCGYVPAYERTDITDTLHEVFGFRTDYEITDYSQMKKIIQHTKSNRH